MACRNGSCGCGKGGDEELSEEVAQIIAAVRSAVKPTLSVMKETVSMAREMDVYHEVAKAYYALFAELQIAGFSREEALTIVSRQNVLGTTGAPGK